jgi:hypothetical protein
LLLVTLACLYLVDTLVNVVRYTLFAVVYVYLFPLLLGLPLYNPLCLLN